MIRSKKKIGEILIANNQISETELISALEVQITQSIRIGEILIKKGVITDEALYSALSEQYGIPYDARPEFNDKQGILENVAIANLKRNKIAPYYVKKMDLHVATSDPLNFQPLDDIATLFPDYTISPVICRPEEIERIIINHFGVRSEEDTSNMFNELEDSDFDLLGGSAFSETEDILDMANEAPIIRFVNKAITEAVQERASDIHIEPYEKDLIVRYRIDGILYRMHEPPKKLQNAIISRIKIMSNLNIAENRLPQDGRIQLKIGKKDIDIRVSIFPTHYGERVVMRLLNKSDMSFDLETIGFSKEMLVKFKKALDKPHGVILVTGPTGSGKSTTLYSALTRLNSTDVNILTVEDPIEYQLNGVGQMQVNTKIGLTFASGLRSILRQDPDIIMVGEIRDIETAEIAIQSALTGHRVFSTIHTNDAASAVTRLADMGIEPFLISSSVNAFLAQRLIRRICPECKTTYKPQAKELSELKIKLSSLKNGKLFHGKGCEKCLGTGYSGRTGIYELLPISNEIKKLVVSNADAGTIKTQAVKEGMQTLYEDGIRKVLEGITTIEEVLRVSNT
ncbi:MAG: type II secretion system ATPase GspE [Spirochaetes bacterium]|jgi:general secretion pathway protein E|nr:type II secretion system ATPase GspE [Spirochaetota bacterium]